MTAAFLIILTAFCGVAVAGTAGEDSFDVLQIGTRTYTNVTVTTKAKNYIFILYQGGMANIRLSELSEELQEKLGYAVKPKAQTNSAATWAKQTFQKLETPQVKQMQDQMAKALTPVKLETARLRELLNWRVLLAAVGVLFAIWLFFSWCCALICRKAGSEPGVLVWLPILQIFPLLKAAGMSGWWFLGLFVPLLNIVAQILWAVKITQARGKSMLVAILLILPPTSVFAFLYLAFSNGARDEKEDKRIEIMTLEAA